VYFIVVPPYQEVVMNIQNELSRLKVLVTRMRDKLAEIPELEILMPVANPWVKESFSRLVNYQKVVTTCPPHVVNIIYLMHAIECAEREASHLDRLADRFLRSESLRSYLESSIRMIETSRPLAAIEMRESLRDYRNLTSWEQASTEEIAEAFISLANHVERNHREVIDEAIAEVLTPPKSSPKLARSKKAAKSASDAAYRASVKGDNPRPPKHGRNEEKIAKRARKSANRKAK
jgi:hypothetical protein